MGEYYFSRITYEGGLIKFTIKNANDDYYEKDYITAINNSGEPISCWDEFRED